MTTLLADYDRECQAFQALLAPDCRERILLFHGESGCGKTTLLKVCREQVPQTIPCAPIQLRGSAVGVAEIFYRSGSCLNWERLPHFTGQVAAMQGVPQAQIDHNWLRGINNRINVALHADSLADQEHRRAALTDAWFQDLRAFDHPVLMVLDTYEQATDAVTAWIDGPFLSRVAQARPLRVLLAGQKVPDENNIEWGHCCASHELLGVPEAEYWLPIVEAMNRHIDVDNPESWLAGVCHGLKGRPKEIMQVIKELPRREGTGVSQDALAQLLAQLQAAQSDEEREWLVMQLSLANMAPPLRQAVWAAAVPHWFDAGFLAALLDEEDEQAYELYQALQVPSFVEPFPGRGYNLHERSRALLLQKLWDGERERYRELSRRAAAYCARQDQTDTGWRVETVYHLLVAEPDRGRNQFRSTGWEWHNSPNFAYDKVETLARLAREHGGAGRLGARGLGWARFWEALLDTDYSRYQAARLKFLQIEPDPKADPALAADVAFRLGDVHLRLDEYADARARYEQALPLYREIGDRVGEANCISSLGHVHLRLDEYADARARYEQALPLYREIGDRLGEANCISSLGEVHRYLDEYADARARYEQALPLYREIGARLGEANCISSLGNVHRYLDEYADARARYEQALPLYREIGARLGEANCISSLGEVHRYLDEYADARARYEQALPLYREIGARLGEANCISSLGDVHLRLDEYAEARARYEQALPLFREIGARLGEANCISSLGHVHLRLAEYADARARYEQALPLYREIGARLGEANCISSLGDVHQQDERWAAAGEKYHRALDCYREIGVAYNEALTLRRLGHTARGAGDPAQARDYYQAALDIFTRIGSPQAEKVRADLDALGAA